MSGCKEGAAETARALRHGNETNGGLRTGRIMAGSVGGPTAACLAKRGSHSRSRSERCGLSRGGRKRHFSPLPTRRPRRIMYYSQKRSAKAGLVAQFFFIFLCFPFFPSNPAAQCRGPLKCLTRRDRRKKKSGPLSVFSSLLFLSQTRDTFDILFNFLSRLLSALAHTLTRLHVRWLG